MGSGGAKDWASQIHDMALLYGLAARTTPLLMSRHCLMFHIDLRLEIETNFSALLSALPTLKLGIVAA